MMNKVAFKAKLSEVRGELHHPTPPETCTTSRDVEVAYQNGKSFLIPGRIYFYAGLAKGFSLGIITFLALGGIVFLIGGGWPAFVFIG